MPLHIYFLASLIFIISSIYYKTKDTLISISEIITDNKTEQNNYQIVMQPKWFLNVIFPLSIVWLFMIIYIFRILGWTTLLYTLGFYFLIGIGGKILPIPSQKQLINWFYTLTNKRLNQKDKYSLQEIHYLKEAHDVLVKLKEK